MDVDRQNGGHKLGGIRPHAASHFRGHIKDKKGARSRAKHMVNPTATQHRKPAPTGTIG